MIGISILDIWKTTVVTAMEICLDILTDTEKLHVTQSTLVTSRSSLFFDLYKVTWNDL